MRLKRYSLLKYVLVPFIAYFFYWAVWVELGILHKPIETAFTDSYPNWIGLIGLSIFEALIVYQESKSREATIKTQTEEGETSPWGSSTKKKNVNPDSLKGFMRSRVDSWDTRMEKLFDSVGKTSFHKHLLLKFKRVSYGICVVLYGAMALLSLNNVPFLILFILTSYAFLENLLWARHYQWVKRKRQNERESK